MNDRNPTVSSVRRAFVPPTRAGFTLIELLISLAAVALLALGIAEIFRVTGKTVAAGRRLSNLTNYAALLERQFRADFGAMTRDGYLVIRHAGADKNGNGEFLLTSNPENSLQTGDPLSNTAPAEDRIQLSPLDTSPRPRRIDRVQFFATGSFVSARDPRHPDRVARSTVARIDYGIGQRQSSSAANFGVPRADDNFDANGTDDRIPGLGRTGGTGINPNLYAADWSLLRQVTLLCPPSGSDGNALRPPVPTGVFGVPLRWPDNNFQHALQPAAPAIFRKLLSMIESDAALQVTPTLLMRLPPAARPVNPEVPRLSSGIVDIAATDLAGIRSVIMGAVDPRTITAADFATRNDFETGPAAANLVNAERMQRWMIQGFPADFDGSDASGNPTALDEQGVRYELTPPNYLGLPNPQTQRDYERVDQTMLTASTFVPRCTEFIVEWSFGQTAPNGGRLLWYGYPRAIDVDGDNIYAATPTNTPDYGVGPYPGGYTQSIKRRSGVIRTHSVNPNLIHFPRPGARNRGALYSCFGYIDPLYAPATSGLDISYDTHVNSNNDPNRPQNLRTYEAERGDLLNDPDTVPWAWPSLIRITMSIADPADPLIERTFQFVVPTAGRQTGGAF